jgi:hypothetical protein
MPLSHVRPYIYYITNIEITYLNNILNIISIFIKAMTKL